jgi:azurin
MPDTSSRQQSLNRRRQLAAALQQQSMLPLEQPSMPGANMSIAQPLAKIAQALFAALGNRKLDKEQEALTGELTADRTAAAEATVPRGTGEYQVMDSPVGEAATMERLAGPQDQANRQAMIAALAGTDPQAQEMAQGQLQNQRATSLQNSGNAQRMVQMLAGQKFDMSQMNAQQSQQSRMAQEAQQAQVSRDQSQQFAQTERDKTLSGYEGTQDAARFAATAAENDKQIQARAELEAADRASREKIAAEQIQAARAKATVDGRSARATTLASQWSNQFNNNDIVKNYAVIQDGLNFSKSLGPTSADDMGLLYAFAKAMDPNSVVREGEYATVQKYAQSWAEAFGFKAARMVTNTRFLSDEARKNMISTIESKSKAAKTSYDNFRRETGKKFENIGEDPEEWIANYDLGKEPPGSPFSGVQAGSSSTATKDGWTFEVMK